MRDRGAVLSIEFPPEIVRRAKVVGKIYRIRTAQLVRDGFEQRVESLEEKYRREEATRAAEKAAKKAKKENLRLPERELSKPIAPIMPFTLSPRAADAIAQPFASTPVGATFVPRKDRLEELYEELAKSIIAVDTSNTEEINKRAHAAVAAVQRERPLTAPPDLEILATLERYVIRLRDQALPETRSYDGFVGAIVALDKMKTNGV